MKIANALFLGLVCLIYVNFSSADEELLNKDLKRELIRDGDNNRQCFDLNYNQGYADYILDPFKANGNRGQWGKCMNGLLFGAMCIHDEMHAINNNQWVKGQGPLHDAFAESMFLRLKELHNNYCLHVDLKFTPVMKEKMNDHFFARNQYSEIATNDTSNTFNFEVLINSKNKYYINGNVVPTLQLLKGSTYSFIMRIEDYAKYPLTFSSGVITVVTEYDMIKVSVTFPFNAPDTINYLSSNGATPGGKANLYEPSYFTITPKSGAYAVNNILSATLTIYRGTKYYFILVNTDQSLFPFMIGTSYGVPYLGGNINIQTGTYFTTFSVTITDPSITKLVYYCVNNPSMIGTINVVTNPYASRKLAMAPTDDDGFMLPFDQTCSGDYKTGDPRALLRMSLYCAVARMDSWIPSNLQSTPYAISSTCDKIVRSSLTSQLYTPKNSPPLQYCSQKTVAANGIDSCTVQAAVNNYQNRTCNDFCQGFDGLTCSAASVASNGIYCQKGRSWSCSAPQQNEWNLICTCTPVGSTPSAAPTAVTVSSAAGVVRTTNQPTTRTPSRSPSFKPSPASTITPTSYPISIYPKNQYIASSCLALLTPTLAKAQSFCSQNLAIDSCTVLASMGAFYPQKGSCSKYCQVVGLACVSAYDGWSCSRGYQRTCDYNRTDSTICECGQPKVASIPTAAPSNAPSGNTVAPTNFATIFSLIGSYYYIGCYSDQWTRALSTSAGWKTAVDCGAYALANGFTYFSLQNYQSSSTKAECYMTNDINMATIYGSSSYGGYARCNFDPANPPYKYGQGWSNAIYATSPMTPAVPTKSLADVADRNTKTCATMLFYHQGPYSAGSKICPRYAVDPLDVDSCTAQPYNSAITCSQYCSSFPGLTCLDGAAASDDTCTIDQTYGKFGCNAMGGYYKLCTCGIDQSAMQVFEKKRDEPISNACLNIMFQPQPMYSDIRQICSSSLTDNSCLLNVPLSYTCSQYCSSFPGMTCINAYVPNGYHSCYADNTQSITCSSKITVTDSILCQCGLVPGVSQESSLKMSIFDNNLPYCPPYPTGTFTDDQTIASMSTRRLDDGSDYQLYGRRYKKIVLTIDYNAAKADGSALVTAAETKWDTNDWRTDSYNTATPEMCTGLVSRIRTGDPPSKCSFGNRPGKDPSQNCYGKLYSMTFAEASNKCAARGGNLARIDSAQEFQAVTSLFVNDGELSIGLYDKTGSDWKWDGFSDSVPSSWFNSTIRFRSMSWYDDCSRIIFNYNNKRNPYLSTASCDDKRTYLCEGKSTKVGNTVVGGDLLADEGGFCIWYYQDPKISLPDDQSGNFRNTELAYFNLYDPKQTSRKFVPIYNKLYSVDNIRGNVANKANFNALTARKFGKNSDARIIPTSEYNSSFHCHYSPTNFGIARIYNMQHMLQRLYTGAANDHCFCGYKNIGYLFDRCDCTRSGEQDNQCLTEQGSILYEETYAQTGEYVSCNNCNNPSP